MNDDLSGAGAMDSSQLHEIRNRLTVVKGVAQLLERQVHRDEWQRDKIVDRVDRLQDEIAQLQDLVETYWDGDGNRPADAADDLIH